MNQPAEALQSESQSRMAAVAVMEYLSQSAKLPFDPVRVEDLLVQSERQFPGTWEQKWSERLTRVGLATGLRLARVNLNSHEAIATASDAVPLLTFASGAWLVATRSRNGSAQILDVVTHEPREWLKAKDLDKCLKKSSEERTLWLSSTPALAITPSEIIERSHVESHGGHGGAGHGGHGDGHHGGHGHHGPEMSPLRRIISILRPERRDILWVTVFAFGVGLFTLAIPIAVESLVNTISFGVLIQPLIVLALLLFGSLTIAAGMQIAMSYIVEYLQQRLFVRCVADFAYRLPRVDITGFDHHHGPELVNRYFDVMTIQKCVAVLLLDALGVMLMTIIGLAILAFYDPLLLIFNFGLLLGLVVIYFLGYGGIQSAIVESRAKYAMASWLEELARHPRTFKTDGGAIYAMERADLLTRDYLQARTRHFNIVMRQYAFALFLQVMVSSLLLGLGGWLVIQGRLTLGQLIAAELILGLIIGSFIKLGKYLESFYDLMAAVDKISHITDLQLERSVGETLPPKPGGMEVKFSHVNAGLGHGHPVVHDFSLHVKPGERVAIVGPPGSGKSLLADMLFGLRDPESGTLEFDRTELRNLQLDWVRQQIGYIQDVEVFEGTIVDNLRIGRSEVSSNQLWEVLGKVGLADAIAALPDSVNTVLSPSGRPFSPGQAMRLCVARVLLNKPRLVVIDGFFDNINLVEDRDLIQTFIEPHAPWTLIVLTKSPIVAGLCQRVISLGDHQPESY